jgi:hypothetical protein
MADKKNQHYVPQFHLKNFSDNGNRKTINLFNIASNRFIGNKAKIQHQSSEDWFYGKDLTLENVLEHFETQTSIILKKMIDSNYFPPRFSEEHSDLISFVCLLSARTKYKEEATNDSIDGFLKYVMSFANEFTVDKKYSKEVLDKFRIKLTNAIHLSLETAIDISPLLRDLKYVLLLNETKLLFWTSDNPVVFYNQLLEPLRPDTSNTYYIAKGLQIFYPISPRHCLLFYDETTYGFGSKTGRVIKIDKELDVEQINLTQYINANYNLYFNEDFDKTYLEKFVEKYAFFRRQQKTITEEMPELKRDEFETYISFEDVEVKCNLKLSFIGLLLKTHKIIGKIKENKNVTIYRSLELMELADKLKNKKKKKL